MTQNDEKTTSSTTTPPTTPVLKKAGLCGTCDCEVTEKSTLEEEALVAVRELSFAVKNIAISEMLPRTPQLLFINVTTLENHTHCIELTGKGWRIASNRNDCMNGDFRQLDIHTQYYDSLYALLTTISPLYREKFSEQLINKLNLLANEQSRNE
ncbi:unnamed protein product [Caenorhabditis angaria]|uniref:GSKIP domain-containing protein n=1 Tax=Caenorhabditis angaria TaxID=860376 RepID=A0A9P1I8C2_9PELO|nr:unnamed protein product [Caenorhabditis angaria]